jgi:iron-sulfur cluster assembly protein
MIVLTDSAKIQIKKNLLRRQKGKGIRLGVRTTGCSGLAYVLEYVDEITSDLDNFVFDDVSVFISKRDQVYLAGLTMDYIKQGLNEGFEFINPNELARCGCGESFSVK